MTFVSNMNDLEDEIPIIANPLSFAVIVIGNSPP